MKRGSKWKKKPPPNVTVEGPADPQVPLNQGELRFDQDHGLEPTHFCIKGVTVTRTGVTYADPSTRSYQLTSRAPPSSTGPTGCVTKPRALPRASAYNLEHLKIERPIGYGASAHVYVASLVDDAGEVYALKEIPLAQLMYCAWDDEEKREKNTRVEGYVKAELELLRLCRYQVAGLVNVVRVYNAFFERDCFWILMELGELGSVESLFRRVYRLPPEKVEQAVARCIKPGAGRPDSAWDCTAPTLATGPPPVADPLPRPASPQVSPIAPLPATVQNTPSTPSTNSTDGTSGSSTPSYCDVVRGPQPLTPAPAPTPADSSDDDDGMVPPWSAHIGAVEHPPSVEPVLAYIAKHMLQGLLWLHEQGLVHRDVNPKNIFVNRHGCVKVGDYGLLGDLPYCQTPIGTEWYKAPEVMQAKRSDGKGDVWCVGVSVLWCALSYHPFYYERFILERLEAEEQLQPTRAQVPSTASPAFQDFLHWCLQVSPDDRPSCKQLLKGHTGSDGPHLFLQQANSFNLMQFLTEEIPKLEEERAARNRTVSQRLSEVERQARLQKRAHDHADAVVLCDVYKANRRDRNRNRKGGKPPVKHHVGWETTYGDGPDEEEEEECCHSVVDAMGNRERTGRRPKGRGKAAAKPRPKDKNFRVRVDQSAESGVGLESCVGEYETSPTSEVTGSTQLSAQLSLYLQEDPEPPSTRELSSVASTTIASPVVAEPRKPRRRPNEDGWVSAPPRRVSSSGTVDVLE